MYNYRKVFYQEYFKSQAGRGFSEKVKEKFDEEKSQFLNEIIPLFPSDKNAKILDIGCGTGSLIGAAKQKGYSNITGIDVSEDQVRVAHSMGQTEVQKQELISYLQQHTNTFDLLTGMDIIEHFSKDELVDLLQLIKKSLKEGGMAIFRTPNMDAPFASVYSIGDFTHENYLNCSSAQQVMMNMGFSKVEVLPSLIRIQNPVKEVFRKLIWMKLRFICKMTLFASGRSLKNVIFTPNLLIRVVK